MVTEYPPIRIVSPAGFDPRTAQTSSPVRLTPIEFQRTPVREQLAATQQYPETPEVDCCHRLGYSAHKLAQSSIRFQGISRFFSAAAGPAIANAWTTCCVASSCRHLQPSVGPAAAHLFVRVRAAGTMPYPTTKGETVARPVRDTWQQLPAYTVDRFYL
jgi:hypothetical protein